MALAAPEKPARKSKMGRPKVADPRVHILSLRGVKPFAAWLKGLSDHARMPLSSVIEHALIDYAKSIGYDSEPPRR